MTKTALPNNLAEDASSADVVEAQCRARLVRRGRMLSYVTLGYNVGEGAAAIIAGALAGSIALVDFGIDSLIEVTSSVAALWRLHAIRQSWADPVAALPMTPIAIREGLEGLRASKGCDACRLL